MKYLGIIFSIYVMILSVAPCGVLEDCNATECQQQSKTPDSQSKHKETCSPFCVCNCCGCSGFKLEFASSTVTVFNQPIQNKTFSSGSSFISQFVCRIWQPPKIA